MIVYVSGTGNSRYCAEFLADRLQDELLDAGHDIRHSIAADLISGKPWVFVAPTYGWRLPRVFEQFLISGSFAGSTDAYFVMTCGGDIGNAAAHIRPICQQLGLNYRGVLQVVMPENYIAMFDAPQQAEAETIIAAATPCLEAAAVRIGEGGDLPQWKPGFADRLKSGMVNKAFYRFFVKADAFTVSEACVGCGKCEASCICGNIRMEQGRPVWSDRCTHCMACICGCPTEAIEYGKKSIGKPRYQCPEYSKTEQG